MTTVSRLRFPEFVFLPVDGIAHLCTISEQGAVEARACAPGNPDAQYKISSDRKFFGFLDSSNKRLAVYELLEAAPWMRRVVPPTNLPRDCSGHDFILHEGQLLVGGSSRSQENIWALDYTLTEQPPSVWQALEVPEAVRKRGKSIDLLYVLNQTLVAVDNVLRPKWFVFYHLNEGALPTPLGIHPLRVQRAFEGIRHGAESDTMYALFSTRAGQRGISSVVQIYFKDEIARSAAEGNMTTMEPERTPYAESKPQSLPTRSILRTDRNHTLNWQFLKTMLDRDNHFGDLDFDETDEPMLPFLDGYEHPEVIPPAPKFIKLKEARATRKKLLGQLPGINVCSMVFCKNWLVLAMCEQGVWVANTTTLERDRRVGLWANFRQVASVQLKNALGFEKREGEQTGVFVIGRNSADVVSYEWLSLEQMTSRVRIPTVSDTTVLICTEN